MFPRCFLVFISRQKPTDCKDHLPTVFAFIGNSLQEELLRCLWEFADTRIVDLLKMLVNEILCVLIISLVCTYNVPKTRIIEVFLQHRIILVYENIQWICWICIVVFSMHDNYPLLNKCVKIIKESLNSLALMWIGLLQLFSN